MCENAMPTPKRYTPGSGDTKPAPQVRLSLFFMNTRFGLPYEFRCFIIPYPGPDLQTLSHHLFPLPFFSFLLYRDGHA